MRISYFMIVSILIMAEGQSKAQVSTTPIDLHIIEPHVFRDWKAALGRPVPPECGISDLKNVPTPLVGRVAERSLIIQAIGNAKEKNKVARWVHNLISKIDEHQKCYKDFVPIELKTKKAIIIRYQYPIKAQIELKELEQWINKSKYYKKYGADTGFLVVEYLYEKRNEQWIQKEFRISADWEGLTDQVQKMHRSYERLGGRKIRRERPH